MSTKFLHQILAPRVLRFNYNELRKDIILEKCVLQFYLWPLPRSSLLFLGSTLSSSFRTLSGSMDSTLPTSLWLLNRDGSLIYQRDFLPSSYTANDRIRLSSTLHGLSAVSGRLTFGPSAAKNHKNSEKEKLASDFSSWKAIPGAFSESLRPLHVDPGRAFALLPSSNFVLAPSPSYSGCAPFSRLPFLAQITVKRQRKTTSLPVVHTEGRHRSTPPEETDKAAEFGQASVAEVLLEVDFSDFSDFASLGPTNWEASSLGFSNPKLPTVNSLSRSPVQLLDEASVEYFSEDSNQKNCDSEERRLLYSEEHGFRVFNNGMNQYPPSISALPLFCPADAEIPSLYAVRNTQSRKTEYVPLQSDLRAQTPDASFAGYLNDDGLDAFRVKDDRASDFYELSARQQEDNLRAFRRDCEIAHENIRKGLRVGPTPVLPKVNPAVLCKTALRPRGITRMEADNFQIFVLTTLTKLKFILIVGPRFDATRAARLLQTAYQLFADHIQKDPFQSLENPLQSEKFEEGLLRAVQTI